jgi:hypothetical protein
LDRSKAQTEVLGTLSGRNAASFLAHGLGVLSRLTLGRPLVSEIAGRYARNERNEIERVETPLI